MRIDPVEGGWVEGRAGSVCRGGITHISPTVILRGNKMNIEDKLLKIKEELKLNPDYSDEERLNIALEETWMRLTGLASDSYQPRQLSESEREKRDEFWNMINN